MRVFIPRFLGAIAYLLVLTVVGTIAYVAIEEWPWREALYMTVITVTSVGFAEVRPLSELGRDFTMLLLAAGITGVGVWFALITSFHRGIRPGPRQKKTLEGTHVRKAGRPCGRVRWGANGSASDGGADSPGAGVRDDRTGSPAPLACSISSDEVDGVEYFFWHFTQLY